MSTSSSTKPVSTYRFGPLLIEAAFIVLGVLLGLMANEWRINQAHEAEADAALEAIRAELHGNHVQVERLLPYHQQIKDSLGVLMRQVYEDGRVVTPPDLFKAIPRGFSVPLLERTAWEMALRKGVTMHLDFDLATALSRLYSQQAFYKEKLDMTAENWYIAGNINPDNLAATAIAVGMLANDIVIQEKRLMERFPAMVARLDSLSR